VTLGGAHYPSEKEAPVSDEYKVTPGGEVSRTGIAGR
jgi:hypothetical protein